MSETTVETFPTETTAGSPTVNGKAPRTVKPKPRAKAAATPAKKIVKANKPAKVAVAPKSPAKKATPAQQRDREAASLLGTTVRGFRLLRSLQHADASIGWTYATWAKKSGIAPNHLPNQIIGNGVHGAGDRALLKLKLVKRWEDDGSFRFALTAAGAKALAKAAGK